MFFWAFLGVTLEKVDFAIRFYCLLEVVFALPEEGRLLRQKRRDLLLCNVIMLFRRTNWRHLLLIEPPPNKRITLGNENKHSLASPFADFLKILLKFAIHLEDLDGKQSVIIKSCLEVFRRAEEQ